MPVSDKRRAEILAMAPEDRAVLADLLRRQRAKIPEQIARLEEDQREIDAWLAEFAPDVDTP